MVTLAGRQVQKREDKTSIMRHIFLQGLANKNKCTGTLTRKVTEVEETLTPKAFGGFLVNLVNLLHGVFV